MFSLGSPGTTSWPLRSRSKVVTMVEVCDIRRTALRSLASIEVSLTSGIVERQHGDGGAQHVHGNRFAGAFQKRGDFGGDRAVGHQRSLQLIEFGLLGQTPVPQQVDDFLKSGVFGQRMNVIALIT